MITGTPLLYFLMKSSLDSTQDQYSPHYRSNWIYCLYLLRGTAPCISEFWAWVSVRVHAAEVCVSGSAQRGFLSGCTQRSFWSAARHSVGFCRGAHSGDSGQRLGVGFCRGAHGEALGQRLGVGFCQEARCGASGGAAGQMPGKPVKKDRWKVTVMLPVRESDPEGKPACRAGKYTLHPLMSESQRWGRTGLAGDGCAVICQGVETKARCRPQEGDLSTLPEKWPRVPSTGRDWRKPNTPLPLIRQVPPLAFLMSLFH
ncbi:uncharacterized protein [Danio rerio]|uniref:Uncharacterized protein n=1 Tax=Danio rerio TaxID=7955 RepID=A0AC58H337_DANRE